MKHIVNKDEYTSWEKSIQEIFYTDKKIKTKLVPTDGNPSVLSHEKVVIMLDFLDDNNKRMSELVKTKSKNIPLRQKIKFFHIGYQKLDLITLGYSEELKLFKHPAIDFGGLTNIGQPLGEGLNKITKNELKEASKGKLLKTKFLINQDTKVNKILNDVYEAWKTESKNKYFYGNMKENLKKVLISIVKYLKKTNQSLYLCFYKLTPQHSVLVSYNDIIKAVGAHYKRLFLGDDNKYAMFSNDKSLYSLVKPKYVNGNINLNNIRNEYKPY